MPIVNIVLLFVLSIIGQPTNGFHTGNFAANEQRVISVDNVSQAIVLTHEEGAPCYGMSQFVLFTFEHEPSVPVIDYSAYCNAPGMSVHIALDSQGRVDY